MENIQFMFSLQKNGSPGGRAARRTVEGVKDDPSLGESAQRRGDHGWVVPGHVIVAKVIHLYHKEIWLLFQS